MTTISKIKLLITVMLCAIFVNNSAFAGNFSCSTTNYDLLDQKIPNTSAKLTIHDQDSDELKKLKTEYTDAQKRYIEICKKANDAFKWGDDYWTVISIPEMQQKIKDLGLWDELKSIENVLSGHADKITEYKASPDACGEKFPYGCPSGESCFKCEKNGGGNDKDAYSLITYQCAKKNPCAWNEYSTKVKNSGGKGSSYIQQAAATHAVIDTNADGETVSGHIGFGANAQSIDDLRNPGPEENVRSNAEFCKIDQLQKDYTDNCYSCLIVSVLIGTFSFACIA